MKAEVPKERPTTHSSGKTMLLAEWCIKPCPNMGKAADVYTAHLLCGLVVFYSGTSNNGHSQ